MPGRETQVIEGGPSLSAVFWIRAYSTRATRPARACHRATYVSGSTRGNGAACRTRTCDPIITNDVLYHLS